MGGTTRELSPDKFASYGSRESVGYLISPYSGRYIQGEPTYSQSHSLYAPHPMPVVISPHEMHRNPHVAPVMPSSSVGEQRRTFGGGPEYVKRPRRRADEVDRLYSCTYPGCKKAYGALNHLNTHVRNSNHGPKREPGGLSTQINNLI